MDTEGLEGTAAFHELTELYLQARFGRRQVDDALVAALARRLHRVGAPKPRVDARAA